MSIYMKFDDIDGPITLKGFENNSQLLSMKFTTTRKISNQPGNTLTREGSKPNISPVIITKLIDKASPLLLQHALQGESAPQVIISRVNTGDSSTYLNITLKNVMISKFAMAEDEREIIAGDALTEQNHSRSEYPKEEIHLNFDEIEYRYTPYSSDNKAETPITTDYNVKTGAKA